MRVHTTAHRIYDTHGVASRPTNASSELTRGRPPKASRQPRAMTNHHDHFAVSRPIHAGAPEHLTSCVDTKMRIGSQSPRPSPRYSRYWDPRWSCPVHEETPAWRLPPSTHLWLRARAFREPSQPHGMYMRALMCLRTGLVRPLLSMRCYPGRPIHTAEANRQEQLSAQPGLRSLIWRLGVCIQLALGAPSSAAQCCIVQQISAIHRLPIARTRDRLANVYRALRMCAIHHVLVVSPGVVLRSTTEMDGT